MGIRYRDWNTYSDKRIIFSFCRSYHSAWLIFQGHSSLLSSRILALDLISARRIGSGTWYTDTDKTVSIAVSKLILCPIETKMGVSEFFDVLTAAAHSLLDLPTNLTKSPSYLK